MRGVAASSVLVMLVFLGACAPPAGRESRPAAEDAVEPPTIRELKNATYRGLEETGGPVTLADGRWEGEPYEEGGASRPQVTLVRDFHVLGDLDGDGTDEAVVLLAESSGGSGTRSHLAVVARRGSSLENLATTMLGDRVQVREVHIESEKLLVDALRAGPDDPACCPGELATLGFTLEQGTLRSFDPRVSPARLSLEVLAGTEWVLRSWDGDEATPAEPEITLQYGEDRFAGRSTCNRYFASVNETGETPGAVEVRPGAGTMMACPDPAGAMESRFLNQLGGVNRFGFVAGQLMLGYEVDGEHAVMLFDGRPPGPEAGS